MPASAAPDAGTPAAAPAGELVLAHPMELVLNVNVRTTVHLDPLFLDSLLAHGVQTPIVGHRDQHGQIVVDQGQRRTLGACEVGLVQVPVWVLPGAPDDGGRIVEQLVENVHRAALEQGELVTAVEQLSLFGWSADQIAARVALPRRTVDAATRVAGSPAAVKALPSVSLEDAAALVEFEDDPEAVADLVRSAERGHPLAAEVERLRQTRREEAAKEALKAELVAGGADVIDPPRWNDESAAVPLDRLFNAKGKELTAAAHKKCPGRVLWVQLRWVEYDKDEVPFATEGCTDPDSNGHRRHPAGCLAEQPDPADPLVAFHAEQRKAWAAATKVRRQWLRGFAASKGTPAGAQAFIAAALAGGWALPRPGGAGHLELLGLDAEATAVEVLRGSPGRAVTVSAAIVAAAWEDTLASDAWAHGPGSTVWNSHHGRDVVVLQALKQWGHDLSAIELAVVAGTAHALEATDA